jgi:hypothetical protein
VAARSTVLVGMPGLESGVLDHRSRQPAAVARAGVGWTIEGCDERARQGRGQDEEPAEARAIRKEQFRSHIFQDFPPALRRQEDR